MTIAVLIGVMISIVVGIGLIPTITGSLDKVTAENPESAAGGLLNVLPYVFVAVLILGAVAWVGGFWEGTPSLPWGRKSKVEEDGIPRPKEIPFYKTKLFWRVLLIGGCVAIGMSMRQVLSF